MEHDHRSLPVRVVRQAADVLATFGLQLVRPARAAERIRRSRSWLAPGVLLVCGHLLVLSAALPVSSTATINHLPASVTEADRLAVVQTLELEHAVRSMFLPVRFGCLWAVFAFWVWLLCRGFSRGPVPRYRAFLSLVIHAGLFDLLARAAALCRACWFSTGDPARDLLVPLSLADLLPAGSSQFTLAGAALFNPFSVMTVLILGFGLHALADLRPRRAFTAAATAWIGSAGATLAMLALASQMLHRPL